MGQGLSQHDIISNAQDYTTFLKLLSNYTRQWNPLFFLSGPYYGKTFSYAQISGKPGLYSILFFHMKKIAIGNLSIKIFSDNSLVVGGKSMQLESSDFNENFKNSFYNQPGALEFATPSVMQTMLELKEQFHDVNIEYFVNSDSDDATLAVFVKGYIFPFPDYDATQIDIYWENFETFAGKAAKLTQ